jgi:hypothetical protein
MKHFILAGLEAVESLNHQDWKGLEKALKDKTSGDLISFDYSEPNSLANLLDQLNGWTEYVELSNSDRKQIKENTSIVFDKNKNLKLPIYWSLLDFEGKAKSNFDYLKENEPEEFATFENWEQIYDKSKFSYELEQMISQHDANIGITWETIDAHLFFCKHE